MRWVPEGLKYLGIRLSSELDKLFQLNYVSLLQQIKGDLRNWNLPHISWLGRINVLRMNVLPRLLYLFQTLPITVPQTYFSDLRQTFTGYVWRGKRARISYSELTRPVGRGGLGLPHAYFYYLAAFFSILYGLAKGTMGKLWENVLQAGITWPLSSLPWQSAPLANLGLRSHPLLGTLLRLWRKHGVALGLTTLTSRLTPLTHNPLFPPGLTPTFLDVLLPKPYIPLEAVVEDDRLLPLDRLVAPEIANKSMAKFQYAQLSHFIRSTTWLTEGLPPLAPFETFCTDKNRYGHIVSNLYSYIMRGAYKIDSPLLLKWETDLGVDISAEEWSRTFELTYFASRSQALRESNCKLFELVSYPVCFTCYGSIVA
uniref:Uncharacterized protein n=1 Tax=Leptobrachium leishanense TaxID=445787 RepID=A0A8C5N506_9ANUR